jgi:hypothetical protein
MTYQVMKLAAPLFDYSGIAPSIVSDLQKEANLIRSLIGRTTAGIIEIGNHLRAVKEHHLVEHGQFITWIEAEVRISKRTAQSYMAIARLAEGKSATVALLPPATAHRLAANSTPVEVVDYVIEQANDGEVVADRNVVEMIKEARSQRQKAKKKEHTAYRRSKAARKNQERERAEWERRRLEFKERISRAAADVIQELGKAVAAKVVEKLTAPGVHAWELLAEMQKQLAPAPHSEEAAR